MAMTVTGTHSPSGVNSCVMPALLPKTPTPASKRALTESPPDRAVEALVRTAVGRRRDATPAMPVEAPADRRFAEAPGLLVHAGARLRDWNAAMAAILSWRRVGRLVRGGAAFV
jgi:hypothetical protein